MFSRQPKGATIYRDKKSGVAGLLWMLFGALVTVIAGVVAYKTGKFDFIDGDNSEQTQVATVETSDEPTIKPKNTEAEESTQKQVKKYDFYEVLPEQNMVSVPDNSLTPEPSEDDSQLSANKFHPDVVVTGKVTDASITDIEANANQLVEQVNTQLNEVKGLKGDKADTNSQNASTDTATNTKLNTSDSDKVIANTKAVGHASVDGDKKATTVSTVKNSNTKINDKKTQASSDDLVIVYENKTSKDTAIKKTSKKIVHTEEIKTKPFVPKTMPETDVNKDKANSQTNKLSAKADSNKSNSASDVNANKLDVNKQKQQATLNSSNSAAAKTQVKASGKTDNNKVKVDSVNKPANKNKSAIKSYILQINSYNSAQEADKRRAQVFMAGVDARVIKSTSNNRTVYQVVSKAMSSPAEVLRIQQRLHKNGIDSLIVEQRRK